MERKRAVSIAVVVLVAALASPVGLAAQQHHHYKLIDIGTFGGPQSYIYGSFDNIPFQGLNNAGAVAGWAYTASTDPFAAVNCFNPPASNGSCYTSRAFVWQPGFTSPFALYNLPKGGSTAANWISANGLVVGASQNGETDPLSPEYPDAHAVLWRGPHPIDLGTLPISPDDPGGGYFSAAHSVNSRGQVVGYALNTVSDPNSLAVLGAWYDIYEPVYPYQTRAFLWEGGVMKDLGTLEKGQDAMAFAINEAGQVIGVSYTDTQLSPNVTSCSWTFGTSSPQPLPPVAPFLYEDGHMINLGSFGFGGTCGWPRWINNHGQIVGASEYPGDQLLHPFLWTKGNGMKDLIEGSTVFNGTRGDSGMINELGEVVGGAFVDPADTVLDAFLWRDGQLIDLGNLGNWGFAYSINQLHQVVGLSGLGGFLWEDVGRMVNLNDLVVSNASGLHVDVALHINDRGEIAGMGSDSSGDKRALVLIPCDQDHPNVAGCLYSMVDASTIDTASTAASTTLAPSAGKTPANPMGRPPRRRLLP